LGVASDISKRKRAEDELRGSREKYRDLYEDAKKTEELYHSLLDSTPDAIIVYDIDGHTQFINDAFTNTFGWILDELQDGAPYVPDSEKEITGIKIKKVVQDGIPVSNFETKRLTKGGRLVDVSISASRFNDHEDNPAGMLVTLHDITERKQAEEKLRKYSKTQEVLLREVNHRVKNNLSAIIGMLYKEEDRAKAEGITDYLAFLGDLKGRIDRLSTVHSLLSASGWRPLLLSRLCEQVINAVLQSVPLNTKISMEIKDSPVRVNSNQAHHLTLVINELATNTLKHALADRDSVRINVDILQENNDVHIIFRDDGSGYPKEMVEGDFGHANVGFDLINGIVEESLRGRVILKNENGAVTNIVFKHDSAQD
jgi:PAS domain S-box-containing protein